MPSLPAMVVPIEGDHAPTRKRSLDDFLDAHPQTQH
jgi:hypothetical protein